MEVYSRYACEEKLQLYSFWRMDPW